MSNVKHRACGVSKEQKIPASCYTLNDMKKVFAILAYFAVKKGFYRKGRKGRKENVQFDFMYSILYNTSYGLH